MTSRALAARRTILFAIACLFVAPCATEARHLADKPSVYTARKEKFTAGNLKVDLVLVTPVSPKPRPVLVIFASGDGGLRGISKDTLQHLADEGYYVAGLSSRDALKSVKDDSGRIAHHVAVASLASLFTQAKAALKLPATTPLVVTGMSRGANMAVISAGAPDLQRGMAGGVAMALTREADFLDMPPGAEQMPGIKVDEKGRVQMYPAIDRIGAMPFAVIQSTKDIYVPSANRDSCSARTRQRDDSTKSPPAGTISAAAKPCCSAIWTTRYSGSWRGSSLCAALRRTRASATDTPPPARRTRSGCGD